ncbi:hypothetical protein FXO38_21124 [Capsicum annuum]|nr:hypothetical protein FXO38_21124 [Capsicum annuum]
MWKEHQEEKKNNSEQDAQTRYEDRRSSNRDVERISRRSPSREENDGEQDAQTRYEDIGSSNKDVGRTSRRFFWRAESYHEQDAQTRQEDRKLPINSSKMLVGKSFNKTNERTF